MRSSACVRAAILVLLAPLCACADAAAFAWPGLTAEETARLGVPVPAPIPDAPVPATQGPGGPEPGGPGPWAAEGMRLLAARNPDAAIRAFRRALVEEGPTPAAFIGLGAAHRALGRLGPALDLLTRAAERWPEEPAARNNLGAVLYDLGRYEAAEGEFRSAADIFMRRGLSPSPEILRNLALAARARQPEAL